MSDQNAQQSTSNWIKILLALSLALNLAVIGFVAGSALKGGRMSDRAEQKDMSFGPFSAALSREDRRALRMAFLEKAPDLRDNREAAKADFTAVVQSLLRTPFDADAFRLVLSAVETRNAARLSLGRSLIEKRILEMSDADRLAFAQRLQAGLAKKGP